ncbi:MAG: hypothetical protein KatS3mg035_0870 [Bacteroidia bacterium]|nr:MAG: hypothetical protein KatS3mg035_0870 [Bacteroidia bacterium]
MVLFLSSELHKIYYEKKSIFYWLIFTFVVSSCGTRSISFQALEPGQITLPADVKTIAVINRYKPDRTKDKVLNFIEGLLTGEMVGTDLVGSRSAVEGLQQKLSESPRVKVIFIPYELKGSGTGFFPDPLPPSEVKKICEQYSADALVSLEAFDHDVSKRIKRIETKKTENGREVINVQFMATKWIRINAGWRVYDATGTKLIDEHQMLTEMGFNNTAPTEAAAFAGIPNAMQLVPRVGNQAGFDYATRIAPHYVWITRSFYSKTKNQNIREGANKARFGYWSEAAEKWIKATEDPDPKTAAKACYNMSIAAEAMGNFDVAESWAKKAYEKHPKSRYNDRIWEIKDRIQKSQRLDMQMAPVENNP